MIVELTEIIIAFVIMNAISNNDVYNFSSHEFFLKTKKQ